MPYRLLADAVLVLHLGVILFVVGGLACIVLGNRAGSCPWVNSMRVRVLHLMAIGVARYGQKNGQAWARVVHASRMAKRGLG